MCGNYINITEENIEKEHLCCIIRTKKPHPGVETKRAWLSQRIKEGHVFRKLDEKGCVFIEYAPLEKAWVPCEGENYLYIYCLWITGEYKGRGFGRELMEYCISDAQKQGKSGVCMLGSQKQKAWLSDRAFAEKFGFKPVDTAPEGYELLALSFDGTYPHFSKSAKKQEIENKELTVFYGMQCPYIYQSVKTAKEYCEQNGVPATFIPVDSIEKAKRLPCVFNNFAVFYGGKFVTVNLLDVKTLERILKNKG